MKKKQKTQSSYAGKNVIQVLVQKIKVKFIKFSNGTKRASRWKQELQYENCKVLKNSNGKSLDSARECNKKLTITSKIWKSFRL